MYHCLCLIIESHHIFKFCFNGDCDANDKLTFFDSIQSLSKRASAREINDSHLYVGKEPYIYRFAGDRTFCIYGDTLKLY